ncbi:MULTISPECIES: hypothetical protein [unclassified Variovorax]|uniref:hypothetical protein n=1 Tax=unclassified Variovorax TaxID=663243 RepID=UPI000F7D74C8|nr:MULTISPECIES: hypothetical protein [unclassified Variovorax]RSZ47567.1 hypothetical protein EJO70_02835 [Variovorax sp. 553]RSZ48309.1 hypothetical protein EJO71_01135 [Variovorax sp. 679]
MPRKFFNLRFNSESSQDSVGGAYLTPEGQGFPCCAQCDRQMIPFLQFTLPVATELPFVEGSRLSVLMCPEHNEIPSFESFDILPPAYWEQSEGHWYASLEKPRTMHRVAGAPILQPAELVLADTPADKHYYIAVGGTPDWVQDAETFTCACGSAMEFVCQVSDGFEFPKLPSAPEQPDSPSARSYVLFLGNEVYVFACAQQCDPRAVWITVQN